MPELNNEFQIPPGRVEATSFQHGDVLDFHTASESAASYEQVRLAREAVTLASIAPPEQPFAPAQPEINAKTFSYLQQIGTNIYTLRQRELDGHLFTDEAA